jgi:hypothetical protein
MLHEDTIPWRHAIVSGWILDPDRKKMSKSKGNVVTPMHLIDEYGADAIRYWAASARLGTDTAFDDKVFKVGKRLVTKIFNAAKFVLQQEGDLAPIDDELDRAFVARLRALVERMTRLHADLEYAHALQETETFFWRDFTDTYLELVKVRVRDPQGGSASAALRLGLDVLLRLFAPMLPYVTEEVWSWTFAEERGQPSIHGAPWPGDADFAAIASPADVRVFDTAVACLAAINKAMLRLLDPRDTALGATMQFWYYSPELGPEFMKKFFGGMEITYAKNFRQMTDWLAQGKFAICMGCKDSARARNQGLPVEDFDTNHWKEGSSFSAAGGSVSYMNQAPHPNAAKVFLNWFLSRKGQIALQKLGDVDDPANSRRIDIPKDDIPPDNRLQPGVKYFDVVKPEYGDMKPIFDLAKEIMVGLEKTK